MGEDEEDDDEENQEQETLEAKAPEISEKKKPKKTLAKFSEQCVLLVTERGNGKRVRLTDFPMRRRGNKGLVGIRVHDDEDQVAALHVVSREQMPPAPARPRDAWVLYREHLASEAKQADATADTIGRAAAVAAEAEVAQAAFNALPEEQRATFAEQNAREAESYTAECEAR